MKVLVPAAASYPRLTGHVSRKTVSVLFGMVLLLAGCSSLKPKLSLSDLRVEPNSDAFQNRFYAGASFGSSSLSPDTSAYPQFSGNDSTTGASQIRFGYDLHNRMALEFDSSVLGEAGVNESSAASIKYSTLGVSALFYALSGNENRNRREKWSGYGRLGLGLNRVASNIEVLDGSDTGVLIGAGVEYGLKNGLGIRGEVTRFDSEVTYAGVGIVFRFNSVRRFVPEHLELKSDEAATVSSRFGNSASNTVQPNKTKADHSGEFVRVRVGDDGRGEVPGDLLSPSAVGAVRVLASALDFDIDGVPNETDKCRDTAAGTAVDADGCGLFDGTLANSTFSNGSAGLDRNVKASLDNLVTRLIAFPEVRVAIEGHTDDKGHEDINMNVSRARAHMVRDYLLKKGVPPQQLETHAYGETRPIADNDSERGRDQNRRIAFITLPSLSRAEIASPVIPAVIASKKVKQQARQIMASNSGDNDEEPVLAAANRGIDLLPATVNIPGLDARQVMENVVFKEKTAELMPQAINTIAHVALVLRRHQHIRVMLAAHTNELDSEEENIKLSITQAQSVARELVGRGVNSRQLVTKGFGDTLPIVQEVSDADRAINRRIELRPVRVEKDAALVVQ